MAAGPVFITSFYPAADRGRGPWSERFSGLYGPIFRGSAERGLESVWYDVSARTLRTATPNGIVPRPLSFVQFLGDYVTDRSGDRRVVLVAYPYCRGSEILTSHRLLNALWRSRHRVLIDVVDPPTLMNEVFVQGKWTAGVLGAIVRQRERSCLRAADVVVTNSAEMGAFLKNEYALVEQSIFDVPMGVDVNDFSPAAERWSDNEFVVAYGGAISADRGIGDLIRCVESLVACRPVRLLLCGQPHPSVTLPRRAWLEVYPSLTFAEYASLISTRAHAGVIPYPVNRWWEMVSISKVATYAAAGIPILCFGLTHTGRLVEQWRCGEVVDSWSEMAVRLEDFTENRVKCRQLGDNARVAAERCLSWAQLSVRLRDLTLYDTV